MKDIFQACVQMCSCFEYSHFLEIEGTRECSSYQNSDAFAALGRILLCKSVGPYQDTSACGFTFQTQKGSFFGWQFAKGFEVIIVCAVGSHDPIFGRVKSLRFFGGGKPYHEPW